MDHEKAARATRKFTRTMSDPEGTTIIELLCHVFVAAKAACEHAKNYGAVGGEAIAPLETAIYAVGNSVVASALDSYVASLDAGRSP